MLMGSHNFTFKSYLIIVVVMRILTICNLAAHCCLVLGLISCGNYLIAGLVANMRCRVNNSLGPKHVGVSALVLSFKGQMTLVNSTITSSGIVESAKKNVVSVFSSLPLSCSSTTLSLFLLLFFHAHYIINQTK